MAPENHLEKIVKAGHEELKSADMWSLGMTMYTILNPSLSGPYKAEFEQQDIIVKEAAFKKTIERQTLPKMHEKNMRCSKLPRCGKYIVYSNRSVSLIQNLDYQRLKYLTFFNIMTRILILSNSFLCQLVKLRSPSSMTMNKLWQ